MNQGNIGLWGWDLSNFLGCVSGEGTRNSFRILGAFFSRGELCQCLMYMLISLAVTNPGFPIWKIGVCRYLHIKELHQTLAKFYNLSDKISIRVYVGNFNKVYFISRFELCYSGQVICQYICNSCIASRCLTIGH